jgi:peptidylprolyl isomerase
MRAVSRGPIIIVAVCAGLAIAGCGGDDSSESDSPQAAKQQDESAKQPDQGTRTDTTTKPTVVVPDGPPPGQLVKNDLVKGNGAVAKAGDRVSVQYVGVDYKTGEEFDTSWGREPFSFGLGAGEVITGWDQGVAGMQVGGRRELIIPPDLAYGAEGAPGAIAPNATLVFVVDLLAVE